ncbi:hypothetical protein EVA_13102 [gut metagenome]|uniref:Uncharacterized protein n=1 Tax=gut metagenome TaxID=749906 RepID=J9GAK4_9ZZZZ
MEIVVQADGIENSFEIMVTIWSSFDNIETDVNLCAGESFVTPVFFLPDAIGSLE